MTILSGILLALAFLLWIALAGNLATITQNDSASRGLSMAFGALTAIAIWLLLAVVLVMGGVRHGFPPMAKTAALVLHPLSCVSAVLAITMLENRFLPRWPILTPLVAPLVIAAFAVWIFSPRMRAWKSPEKATLTAWGAVLVLTLAPLPLFAMSSKLINERAEEARRSAETALADQEEAERQQNLAGFKRLTPDSHLREWAKFTRSVNPLRDQALEGIRGLARRQADAERMLDERNDFPVLELPHLALEPTPPLCEKARKFMRGYAASSRPRTASPPPYSIVETKLELYLPAIEWLSARGCRCDEELADFENLLMAYGDSTARQRVLETIQRMRKQ
jgi:hypothetical protein